MSACANNQKTEVDRIITNAKIYTSDPENLYAEACAIKDGKFIMPAIIDGHVHVPFSITFDYAPTVT